jgi:predicted dehydrogenase
MSQPPSPIRIALVGAGIFAQDAHLPALLRLADRFFITTIFSRTEKNAQQAAALLPHPVKMTTSLADLLEDSQIDAVDLLLPIDVQPVAVEQALAAGKHIISEKPIAPTTAIAHPLIEQWRAHPDRVWMVGENWRYETAFVQTAELVRNGVIGRPITCSWALHQSITPTNRYYHTEWRRSGRIPGGFLLDGGVHHVAALRLILGEIESVAALSTQASPHLPPADTLSATLRFASGVMGSYLACYAAASPWPPALHIVGDAGSLRVERGRIDLTRGGATETISCPARDGLENELAAFADAIQHGVPHRNTPQEALADLQVVEAILEASTRPFLVIEGKVDK